MITPTRAISSRPQVWAVGGGKGGTGKSLVAASLGIHLAQMGRRVILVDGDLGAPNLHTVLGLDPPALALSDFVKRRLESIETVGIIFARRVILRVAILLNLPLTSTSTSRSL